MGLQDLLIINPAGAVLAFVYTGVYYNITILHYRFGKKSGKGVKMRITLSLI